MLKRRRRGARLWGAWVLALGYFWLARPDEISLWAGGAVVLGGLVIRGWAAGVVDKDRALAVSGPYAFTRNPLYLGSFVIGVGAVVAGGRLWIGAVFLAFYVWAYGEKMTRETGVLEARFGEDYRDYRRSVPAFLPRLTPYRVPGRPGHGATRFSLARYLHNREWEAILGAVAAMGFLVLKAAGWSFG